MVLSPGVCGGGLHQPRIFSRPAVGYARRWPGLFGSGDKANPMPVPQQVVNNFYSSHFSVSYINILWRLYGVEADCRVQKSRNIGIISDISGLASMCIAYDSESCSEVICRYRTLQRHRVGSALPLVFEKKRLRPGLRW